MNKSLNITDLIDSKKAMLTEKILDYYDGDQDEHLIKLMNDPSKGRKDWNSRGLIPRTRNILKMIIEKSGLLFSDKAPTLDVHVNGVVNEAASAILQKQLENIDWVEFFNNFDGVVRMLKTALVLVQFDEEAGTLAFDILTQQNSAVVTGLNKQMTTLIYRTSGNDLDDNMDPFDKTATYIVYTKELIQEISVNRNGEESITGVQPNPFGMIPVVAFHDTNTPRSEFWNCIPTDLVQINDMYNLHITDSEFAASWAKQSTLFTNAKIVANEDVGYESQQVYGSALPTYAPTQGAMIGGPGQVISIDSQGVDNILLEYKSPVVDLQPIDDMVNKWVADFAADWAVNVKFGGNANADSGFKLVVEEMPNLELRKKRARMFEAGFKRLYKVISKVVNLGTPGLLPEDGELFAQFQAPILPVNQKENEEVWSRKILEGRATRVDYFMVTQGMTKQEAEAKVAEIDAATAPIIPVQRYQVKLTPPSMPAE
jgi:hypothetical protein